MQWLNDVLISFLKPESGALSAGQAILALAVTYLGGVLSSLTPCIYPMIPITIGVIGGSPETLKTDARRSWKPLILRSAAYVAGMTLTYSFLGVIAALSGRVFGTLTQSAGWYLAVGIVMTVAALMMLEVIHFDPTTWFSRSSKVNPAISKQQMSLLGAFTLGATSGFIAAPCTTPVLASVLVFIAKTQSAFMGFTLMVAFSIGLSTILLVIAAFAGAVRILPRSGNWMKLVKLASGIILLAFAEYLLYRAGSLGGL